MVELVRDYEFSHFLQKSFVCTSYRLYFGISIDLNWHDLWQGRSIFEQKHCSWTSSNFNFPQDWGTSTLEAPETSVLELFEAYPTVQCKKVLGHISSIFKNNSLKVKIWSLAHHQWMRLPESFSSVYSNLPYPSRSNNFVCVHTVSNLPVAWWERHAFLECHIHKTN